MKTLQHVCSAWASLLWVGVWLMLAASAAAQPVGKTFVVGWGGELWELTITPEGTLVNTRFIPAPNVGEFQGQSPTGEFILYTKPRYNEFKQFKEELYLADKEGQYEQHIPHTRDRVTAAHWDWTGRQFLFLTYGNRGVWLGEILSDKSVQVREVAEGVSSASFSPDGNTLILERRPASGRPGLWLLNLVEGTERLVSRRVIDDWWVLGYAPEWTGRWAVCALCVP